ncbi:MAG TPA: DinB family protein [Blastocatellia bacterium]|nr:DinB family protein [Blastocatellia bacterium]
MIGYPERDEAAPYYFNVIDLITSDDIVSVLETQGRDWVKFLESISEEKSLHRYGPEKWSIRGVVSHLNDSERIMIFRAFWFARGLEGELPSYEPDICSASAHADERSWASHLDEFRSVRESTMRFLQSLPDEEWLRKGVASGNSFTVRSLAYVTAGHVEHHRRLIRERYLVE